MNRDEIKNKATNIFRDVFYDDNIILEDSTTADDIEDWDSLSNITLICELEEAFDCKFSINDINNIKNVGDILDMLVKQGV